jgi:U4/U6.U5 tri-snRNP-associated protein 3
MSPNKERYDHRRTDRKDRNKPSSSNKRDRSRSRSPDNTTTSTSNKTDEFEAARLNRMARLRSQNQDEERRLESLDDSNNNSNNDTDAMKKKKKQQEQKDVAHLDPEEQMKILMGFGGFGSTKGDKVEDNHNSSAKGAASKNKSRKYRQYMNRKVRRIDLFFPSSLSHISLSPLYRMDSIDLWTKWGKYNIISISIY